MRLIAPRRDKKSVIMLLQGLIKFHIRYNCICLCITSHIFYTHLYIYSLIIKLKFIVLAHVEEPRHFGSTMTREGRKKWEFKHHQIQAYFKPLFPLGELQVGR